MFSNFNLDRLCDVLKNCPNVIFTEFPVIHHNYFEDGMINQTCVTTDGLKFDSELKLLEHIHSLKIHGYSFYIFNNSVSCVTNPMDFTPMIVLRGKAVKGLKVSPMKIKQKDNDRKKYLLLA
jgi:hypothetical protein